MAYHRLYCRSCKAFANHVECLRDGLVECMKCAQIRHFASRFGAGDFPELTAEENETIHEARAAGYVSCYPAYPDAEAQAQKTLAGARKWLEEHPAEEQT